MREQLLKIADRLDERADAIFNNLYREYFAEEEIRKKEYFNVTPPHVPLPKSQMAGALRIFAEEIRETLENVSFREFDDIGELFTLEEFESRVEATAIISSDGEGFYAEKQNKFKFAPYGLRMMVSSLSANPSRIAGGDVNRDFTHVAWYNK